MATYTEEATSLSETQDILDVFGVSAEQWPKVKETLLKQSKSEANILMMGKTGTGKSTLINALCGAVPQERFKPGLELTLPAKVGDGLHYETLHTACYEARSTQISRGGSEDGPPLTFAIRVWDTPGLFDGTGNERSYVMQANVRCTDGIDLLLYCISMSRRCILTEMVPGMKLVTEILGQDVWKHTIIVLTFANNVKPRANSTSDDDI